MLGELQVEEFPLDKISSLRYSTGLILGEITVFTSGNKAVIKNVDKGRTGTFAEAYAHGSNFDSPRLRSCASSGTSAGQFSIRRGVFDRRTRKARCAQDSRPFVGGKFAAAKKKLLGL